MRTAEKILTSLGYVQGDPEISFVELSELIKVVQREVIIECSEQVIKTFQTMDRLTPGIFKQDILKLSDQIK